MASYLINCIPDIQSKRYLELGIYKGSTFNAVHVKDKVSVDLYEPAMFRMDTDSFFRTLGDDEKFDVIYIDACHEYHHVVSDFNNSVNHLNPGGLIFVHDLIPPTEEMTSLDYCGDGFKLLHHIITNCPEQYEYRSLAIDQGDYGLTVFVNPVDLVYPPPGVAQVSYQQFRQALIPIKLYTRCEIQQFLGELS